MVLFNDYLIIDDFGEIENFTDFRKIFGPKNPRAQIGQVASEKVLG
jgi:hypothetical protein